MYFQPYIISSRFLLTRTSSIFKLSDYTVADGRTSIPLKMEVDRSWFVVFSNDSNKGIVYSLNKAVSIASGQYIARMDADDISNIDRLSSQLDYLKLNNLDICGTSINAFGLISKKIINYPESIADVKFFAIFGSPLAHPTAFGFSHLFKKYLYRDLAAAEDYDLWERMLKDGINDYQFYIFVGLIKDTINSLPQERS